MGISSAAAFFFGLGEGGSARVAEGEVKADAVPGGDIRDGERHIATATRDVEEGEMGALVAAGKGEDGCDDDFGGAGGAIQAAEAGEGAGVGARIKRGIVHELGNHISLQHHDRPMVSW